MIFEPRRHHEQANQIEGTKPAPLLVKSNFSSNNTLFRYLGQISTLPVLNLFAEIKWAKQPSRGHKCCCMWGSPYLG
jgi:hypothetical protein